MKWIRWFRRLQLETGETNSFPLTSIIKSLKGFRLSSSSGFFWSSRLYLTRNSARFFSSLDTFSRRSIFSTSSGLWSRDARMVMGLGEFLLAFFHTRFISSMSPSCGKPAQQQQEQRRVSWQLQRHKEILRNIMKQQWIRLLSEVKYVFLCFTTGPILNIDTTEVTFS